MNAEASARSRKAVKVWVALVSLAALVAIILLTSRSTRQWNETVTFKLLDYDSHQSISNFTVTIYRRWTAIPLEKLTLRTFSPWRETRMTSADAAIKLFVPAAQLRTYVVFVRRVTNAESSPVCAKT